MFHLSSIFFLTLCASALATPISSSLSDVNITAPSSISAQLVSTSILPNQTYATSNSGAFSISGASTTVSSASPSATANIPWSNGNQGLQNQSSFAALFINEPVFVEISEGGFVAIPESLVGEELYAIFSASNDFIVVDANSTTISFSESNMTALNPTGLSNVSFPTPTFTSVLSPLPTATDASTQSFITSTLEGSSNSNFTISDTLTPSSTAFAVAPLTTTFA